MPEHITNSRSIDCGAMEKLLKGDFVSVINNSRRNNAPEWTALPQVRVEDIDEYTFDVIDPQDDAQTVKRPFGEGTASYVNGEQKMPYKLHVVCYDIYLHQFVFDDGQGHSEMSLLKDNTKMADLIVYDREESHKWFVVHELKKGAVKNKRNLAQKQLNATVNMLFKAKEMKAFIDGFSNKMCIYSAKDERVLTTPNGIADAFLEVYEVLPDPREFNYGVINRFGFRAFETSKVILE